MASIFKTRQRWFCRFMYLGRRFCFPLGEVSPEEADLRASQVDLILLRLKQGLLTLPPGCDIVTFVERDGKPPVPPDRTNLPPNTPRTGPTLGLMRDEYLRVHQGSLEKTTWSSMKLHFNHLIKTLGETRPLNEIDLAQLQEHATRRQNQKGPRGKISPATVKKELVTLRTAWNWAKNMKWVKEPFPPLKLVRLIKSEEKPHFMTRAEIERYLPGSTPAQVEDFWDSLYLTPEETLELLEFVKEKATNDWIYPFFCFIAFTGARRAETLRTRVVDVDLVAQTVVINERKRRHDKRTTRRVPLNSLLKKVLQDWLARHPGGSHLFVQAEVVARSKKRSRTTGHQNQKIRPSSLKGRLVTVQARVRPGPLPVTKDEVHDHLRRVLRGSKWDVLRGFHTLRHSFISACASRGVDQRLIDEWVGHQTEEQRQRYRHLFPSVQQAAIESIF